MNSCVNAKSEDLKADLVIIGGGGAGLAAAVVAAEKGVKVIVLEKRVLGGNSALAWGLFAAESPIQRRAMIDCRRDDCYKTAMNYAHLRINPRIVRAFIDKSGDTIRWLEKMGIEFDCVPLYPNHVPTWHIPKGRGAALMKVLARNCRDLDVQILIHTAAKKILTSAKGNISGVVAESKGQELRIMAKSIIIATGGYGGNKKLLKKYSSNYHDNMEGRKLPQTGDGLTMATQIGAATEGLGTLLMAGPTPSKNVSLSIGTPPNSYRIGLLAIALEPYSIWVNKRGERFIDETTGYNHFQSANAVARQPDNITYTVFDHKMIQNMTEQGLVVAAEQGPVLAIEKGRGFVTGLLKGSQGNKLPGLERELQKQAEKGVIKISNSWGKIASWMGADPAVIKTTIDEYNTACDHSYDPIFSKDRIYLLPLSIPPYYVLKCQAILLNTIGGIKINQHMEVLDSQDNPIPGLYAAGVDTGGWESETYCGELSGHAFGFAINSGRIAGENSAKLVLGS